MWILASVRCNLIDFLTKTHSKPLTKISQLTTATDHYTCQIVESAVGNEYCALALHVKYENEQEGNGPMDVRAVKVVKFDS